MYYDIHEKILSDEGRNFEGDLIRELLSHYRGEET